MGPLKIKTKSSSRIKKRNITKPENSQVHKPLANHQASVGGANEPRFLDKVQEQSVKNYNYVSKSLGREKPEHENKVKILEPQFEHTFKPRVPSRRSSSRQPVYASTSRNSDFLRQAVQNKHIELANVAKQFATLDDRQNEERVRLEGELKQNEKISIFR